MPKKEITNKDVFELIKKLDSKLITRIEKLDSKQTTSIEKLDSKLTTRIDNLDSKIVTAESKLSSRIDKLDSKISKVESKLSNQIDNLAQAASKGFTDVYDKFYEVNKKLEKQSQAMREIIINLPDIDYKSVIENFEKRQNALEFLVKQRLKLKES